MSPTAGAETPPLAYIAPFLEARRRGEVSDHIHLGYWAAPPSGPIGARDWAAAQARLSARLIAMADLGDGQRIADIGCGIGGTLRAIAAAVRPDLLIGVNIDARQLALCPGPEAGVALVRADACRLPLAPASVDRLLCIEAAFHFPDRAGFLSAAARALRPGGRLVLADILIDPAEIAPQRRAEVARVLLRDFGPWPGPWITPEGLRGMIGAAGLRMVEEEDATAATLPSYAVVACRPAPASRIESWSATHLMRRLQERGSLKYWLVAAQRC